MRKEELDFQSTAIFEGITSIRAVIESGSRKIERILCDSERLDARAKELGWLKHRAIENGFEITAVSKADIDAICTGTSHGGLVAVCGERELLPLEHAATGERSFFVMLEGIEDPYNFGYSIRSIYASGADGIVLTKRNWMSASGIVCRSSAGASERIPMYVADSSLTAAEYFKSHGYNIVCAEMKKSVPVEEADLKMPIFLIVGGEKRGLSRAVLDMADCVVRLDYGRPFGEALSAASASAILAYEVYLRNKQSNKHKI